MIVKRGDIFYADLSPVVGSEQGGVRPILPPYLPNAVEEECPPAWFFQSGPQGRS